MDENTYEHWHAVLAGEKPPITNQPMPGFYRTKDGTPVAIWWADDGLQMQYGRDGGLVDPDRFEDIWLRCAMRAVTQAAYEHVVDEGGVWPDMDAGVAETMGDNIRDANDVDTIERLLGILEQAAQAYQTIETDEAAQKAQSIRARALELTKKADDIRKREKEPHLAAGKKIDLLWQPIVKSGQGIADGLRQAMSLFETKKLKAARKAEEERLAREALDMPPSEEIAPAAMPDGIKAGYGRAASTRLRKIAVLVDIVSVFEVYRNRAEVQELLMKLAQKDLDNGIQVPGIMVTETVDVR